MDRSNGSSWSVTGVYGPQSDDEKIHFLNELRQLKNSVLQKWMVLGGFNLIFRANEKSNTNLNLGMIGRFKNAIDALELKDLPLTVYLVQ